MRHITFDVEEGAPFALCAGCGARADLPNGRGSLDWPSPVRKRIAGSGGVIVEVPPCHPGTEVPIKPPRWQALTDFLVEHEKCGPPSDVPAFRLPPRAPASCVLGPVTIVPDEVYRVIVSRGGERTRTHYENMADAQAAADAARAVQ